MTSMYDYTQSFKSDITWKKKHLYIGIVAKVNHAMTITDNLMVPF